MKTHRITLGGGRFRNAICLVNGAEEMLAIDGLVQHISITIAIATLGETNGDHIDDILTAQCLEITDR